jgi:DNA-directed RNA polymerase I, II, and III subunit RPABC2
MEDDYFDFGAYEEEQEEEVEDVEEEDLSKVLEEEDDEFSVVPAEQTQRITTKFLTKYERTRVIGMRYTQLQKGAKPLVKCDKNTPCYDIVMKEIKEKKLPFIIRRTLPDETYEDWKLSELEI